MGLTKKTTEAVEAYLDRGLTTDEIAVILGVDVELVQDAICCGIAKLYGELEW